MDLSNFVIKAGNKPREQEAVKTLIIGSGPAGSTAALYSARAELQPVVVMGTVPGGQAALTHTIENFPGFPDGIGGMELGELFQKQAERFGARFDADTVSSVDLSKRPFSVITYAKEYLADSLVIATGARSNLLNVPGEKELTGKGTSYCATCDGWFFKGKPVVVVGGGDSALEESLFLTRFATSVTIIHRRDTFRAGAILQKRIASDEKIKVIYDSVVTSVNGSGAVESLTVRNVKTGQESNLPTKGLFIFIGHKPNTDIFSGQLDMDGNGYIKVDNLMRTSVPGVFAAGEAADPDFRQVITSAGMGAAAAIQLTKFLENNG
jgi:thioredoxin reductase (NADPH)